MPVSIRIETNNVESLRGLSRDMPEIRRSILSEALNTLRVKVQAGTPVGLRYEKYKGGKGRKSKWTYGLKRHKGRYVPSGELKRSWQEDMAGDSVRMWNEVKYASVLEEGAYPGIGKPRTGLTLGGMVQISPRTTTGPGGKIFSSRAVGGMLKPIADDPKVLDKMVNAIVSQFRRYFR